ncbi:MAG TPA: ATP-binding cassette domain-containing protein [Labilithrix sp.]|nr:ATP-binding cassette domain-containing protein [Labilithrix sp.]
MTTEVSAAASADDVGIDGLRAVVPLHELLKTHGIETSRQALVEECGVEFSLGAMAKCIERRGLRTRVISVMKSDLPHLGVALVELRDRTTALLRASGGRQFRLELADGAIISAESDVEEMIGSQAIEVDAPWSSTGSFLRRILRMCLDDERLRSAFALFCVTLVLSGAFGFAQPVIARHIVDGAIPENAPRLLVVLASCLLLVAAMSALIGDLGERAALYVENRLSAAAYRGVFAHYLALPFPELNAQTAGGATQTIGGVSSVIRDAVRGVVHGSIDLLLALGYSFWIANLAPQLAVGMILAHVVLAALVIPSAQQAARRKQELLKASEEQSDRLLELVNRVATLRAELAFDWALGRWLRALHVVQEQGLRFELSNSVVTELVGFVQRLVVGVTVLWAAYASLTGEHTLGEFFAVVAAATAANGAFMRLISRGAGLLSTRTQLERIDRVLAKETAPDVSGASIGPRPEDGIVVDGLWFRYGERSPWVIRDFSVSFAAGSVTTIRWPSGQGKSTLLRLIAGLHSPQKGAITISGLDAKAARHLVAYVPQNCPIFAGSVLQNLRTLSGGAPKERIDEAVRATGLGRIAEGWPMGLETVLSGGSGNISSGQRQLVIFTAALASRRPILLLDEATTHLDSILRVGLRDSPLLAGRTIVNVMHFDDAA